GGDLTGGALPGFGATPGARTVAPRRMDSWPPAALIARGVGVRERQGSMIVREESWGSRLSCARRGSTVSVKPESGPARTTTEAGSDSVPGWAASAVVRRSCAPMTVMGLRLCQWPQVMV